MNLTPDLRRPSSDHPDGPGHTFVVNGVLEGLGWDAAIIPTDPDFTVSSFWRPAVGLAAHDPWAPMRPDGWGRGAAKRAKSVDDGETVPLVWFLDVVSPSADDLGARAADCIRAMVAADRTDLERRARAAQRARPLVALTVIGVGAGGHGRERGTVIRGLLRGASAAARDAGVDVVIVARSRADYAALQHLRAGEAAKGEATSPLRDELVDAARALGEKASKGELALFIGAGVSMSAGLPSWTSLIHLLAASPDAEASLKGIDLLKHGPLEQATLLDAASKESTEPLGEQIATIIKATTTPGLSHALLVGLRCREVVTTNYDKLYETAVDAILPESAEKSDRVAVAPWDRPSADGSWILKMHGDVEHPGSIVLTRRSFVRYDAHWKPVGSIVQSLMMTRHLLVLGASMTDDNLVRFAHEVGELRDGLAGTGSSAGDGVPEIGTIVTLFDSPALRKLWDGRFTVVGATEDPAPEASDLSLRATPDQLAARALSIFLDAIGMYAVRDASYLLDRSYEPTSSEGREVAEHLQALGPRLAALRDMDPQGDWAKLGVALTAFGLEIRGDGA